MKEVYSKINILPVETLKEEIYLRINGLAFLNLRGLHIEPLQEVVTIPSLRRRDVLAYLRSSIWIKVVISEVGYQNWERGRTSIERTLLSPPQHIKREPFS